MNILVKKATKIGLLKLQLIGGGVLMVAAMLMMPIGLLSQDASLLANPYILCVVAGGMLFFGLVGYFICIRPYLLYRKLPLVLAKADAEFLYIHTKKEAKIPLADLSDVIVRADLPYLYQKEFLGDILVHLFSERYGDIFLEIPGYGEYRLRFAAEVNETAAKLVRFIDGASLCIDENVQDAE